MYKKILFVFLIATAVMCFMFGGNVHYNFIYSIAVAVITTSCAGIILHKEETKECIKKYYLFFSEFLP